MPRRPGPLASTVSGVLIVGAVLLSVPARSQPEGTVPACYPTAGGALEICRSGNEPEGVFFATPACQFAYDVQILRVPGRIGPLQVIHHSEPRRTARDPRGRGRSPEESCDGNLRATDANLGGSLRSGRQTEQLAMTMPPTGFRFWGAKAADEQPRRKRRRGRRTRETNREEIRAIASAKEGSAGRNPMTVIGRDWAGDDYHYVFMVASEAVGSGRRHVLIQARTYDFESLDVRVRAAESDATEWKSFGEAREAGRRRARRPEPPDQPDLAPVLDETGKAITGNCPADGFDARGLVGSISVVDRTYHYFYTDVLPSDCNEPFGRRRMALYLRTSRDLTAAKPWSAPRTLLEGLPADTLIRVAKGKAMERWALAYSCYRPANAPGGPIADICLHYTQDLSVESIGRLSLFSEPAIAGRSPAYLGLRSGGDGSGRYGRDGFFWMTDRYGNLETPGPYPGKGGLLTWLDRLAPRSDGSEGSSLYGRPVYWSTWTVRPR